MNAQSLKPAGAMFICGDSGCDSIRYLRCPDCGWTCIDPESLVEDDGQLSLDQAASPEHTRIDCLRIQREHPRRTPAARTAKQQRAHNAYQRIHERHAPARMVRRHGALTCPRCGFQP